MTDMLTLLIIRQTLTDQSEVYDVHVPEMRLAAITHTDAAQLANAIKEAIAAHTNERARVIQHL